MGHHYYRVAAPNGEGAAAFRETFLSQFQQVSGGGDAAKIRKIKDDFHVPAGHVVLAVDLKGSPTDKQAKVLEQFAYRPS